MEAIEIDNNEDDIDSEDYKDFNAPLAAATIHYNSTGPDVSEPDTPAANPVTVASASHGTVTAAPASAKAGEKVTLTVKPEQGYELDKLTVTDASGKAVAAAKQSDGTYTFTMSASAVTVQASFKEAQTEFQLDVEIGEIKIEKDMAIVSVIVYVNGTRLLEIPVTISLI